MTISGYVPAVGETELNKVIRSVRNIYENLGSSNISTFENRTAAAAANIPGSTNAVRVEGFAAAGDGGAALYKRVNSLASSASGFQSNDGTYWQIAENILRPEMFSSVADTSAIQTAIDVANAIGTVGEVRLRSVNYRAVKQGSNAYCLHLYGNVSLVGEGPGVKDGTTAGTGTIISWGSTIATTTDIISWTGDCYNQKITGIQFMMDGFTATNGSFAGPYYGQDVINVNAGTSKALYKCEISNNLIGPANGWCIGLTKTGAGADGDFGASIICNNAIWSGPSGCIYGAYLLDNVTIRDNKLDGVGIGIDVTQCPGAGNLLIEHNNGTTTKGAVFVRNGVKPVVRNNYFELNAIYNGVNGYLYNMNGSAGTLTYPEFSNNICNQNGSYGLTGLVLFHNTVEADIDGNGLYNAAAGSIAGIYIDTSNSYPYCGATFQNTNLNAPTDPGRPGYTCETTSTVAPIGLSIPMTLQNGWVATADAVRVRRSRDGTCHITGSISSGTTTAGTLIFTLPTGFHPVNQCNVVLATNAGTCVGQIATGGNFTWVTTASATLTSLHCMYMTATSS